MSPEEMDRIIQEHFDAHGQVNPNKNSEGTIQYLNQFHKESTERKMKKLEESKNSPTTYETVMQQQKIREQLTNESHWKIEEFSKEEEFVFQIEIDERNVLMAQFEKYKNLISPFSEQTKSITKETFREYLNELEMQIGKYQIEIIRELDYVLRLYEINPKGTLNEMIQAYRNFEWLEWDIDDRAIP